MYIKVYHKIHKKSSEKGQQNENFTQKYLLNGKTYQKSVENENFAKVLWEAYGKKKILAIFCNAWYNKKVRQEKSCQDGIKKEKKKNGF